MNEFEQCISEWVDRVAERDKEIAQLQARLTVSKEALHEQRRINELLNIQNCQLMNERPAPAEEA